MGVIWSFLLGVTITVGISAGVVFYLGGPLRQILVDLCGTEDRADFWTAFSRVTVVLGPVICSLFYLPTGHRGFEGFLFDVAGQLRWALVGLIVAVVLLGAVVASFIPKSAELPKQG